MRVLILHSRYMSGVASGENRVAEDEARLLQEAGHEVHSWSPSPDTQGPLGSVRSGTSAVWSGSAIDEVRRLVRRHRPQVVHVHNLFPVLSPAVLRTAALEGAAVVMTLHNYRLMCLPANFLRQRRVCELCLGRVPWRGVVYRCYRDSVLGSGALAASLTLHRGLRTFERVHLFLAVSRFVKEKHVEGGLAPQRITVKPHFAWPGPRRRGPGDYYLFVGRLSPEKGVDIMLEASREVPGRVLVVGAGPEADAARRAAPPQAEFTGEVAAAEIPSILAGARAVLVPSRSYETAGKVILEAYAAGVPVVASRIGALPEVVEDGMTGLLANPHRTRDWVEAMTRLADDRTSERLGEGAFRAWSDRYSPRRGLRDLEAAYQEALGDGDLPGRRVGG
jgi:glycosyltransferase involved in cell wall biosynthesis